MDNLDGLRIQTSEFEWAGTAGLCRGKILERRELGRESFRKLLRAPFTLLPSIKVCINRVKLQSQEYNSQGFVS